MGQFMQCAVQNAQGNAAGPLAAWPKVLRFPCCSRLSGEEGSDTIHFEADYESDAEQDRAPHAWRLRQLVGGYEKQKIAPGDSYFWNILRGADVEEVFLVDLHFSSSRFRRLFGVLKERESKCGYGLTRFVVLSSYGRDEWNELEGLYNENRREMTTWKHTIFTISEMNPNDAEIIHDRFVLIGNVIWHFGAAVGGMHADLHAFSGPWEDRDCRLLTLFKGFSSRSRKSLVLNSGGKRV